MYVLLESLLYLSCVAEEVPVAEYTLPLSKAEVVVPGQYTYYFTNATVVMCITSQLVKINNIML